MGASIESAESDLLRGNLAPSPVMAVPYLSGSMTDWKDAHKAKGAIVGLTRATRPLEIIQASMESIAYDNAKPLALLENEGVPLKCSQATSGGAHSAWWTQLKADITTGRLKWSKFSRRARLAQPSWRVRRSACTMI